MAFTKSTEDLIVHQKMADYPIEDGQYTVEDLKKELDRPAEALQRDLNKVIDELAEETSASNLGADKLESTDLSDSNVQAKLRELNRRLQNVVLGQIPDGSVKTSTLADGAVTEEKISGEYTNKLVENIEGSKAEINANLGLVSNYNEPTIIYLENYKIETEIDILPKTWETVTEGTKYKNGNIIIEADSYREGYPLINAFDDSSSTEYGVITNAKDYTYIIIDFNEKVCITEMHIESSAGWNENSTIQCSNNKSNWVDVNIENGTTSSGYEFKLQTNTAYRYYKIGFYNKLSSQAVVNVKEIKVVKIKQKAQLLELFNDIKEYKKGMIVKIQTPSTMTIEENCLININGLGEKTINNTVKPNRKYTLIYDGEKFIVDDGIVYDVTLSEAVAQIDLSNILKDNSGYIFLIKMPSGATGKLSEMRFSAIAPDNVSSSNPTTTFSYAYGGSNYVLPIFLFIKNSYICGMGYSDNGKMQQFFSGDYRIDVSNLFLNGPTELFIKGTSIQIRRLY
jgi:hypothetical protein